MKAFVNKIVTFSILLGIILSLIKCTVPYYWGAQKDLVSKMKFLESVPNKYDRIFIGSSMMYRSTIPKLFDQKVKDSLTSFSLAAPHTFHYEAIYLAQNLIDNYEFKELVFLVQKPEPLDDRNLHTVESKYYLDWETFKLCYKYSYDYKQKYNYALSYIENILCIGEIEDIIKFHLADNLEKAERLNNQNGYYSLNTEFNDTNKKDPDLIKRKRQLKNSPNKNMPVEKRKMDINRYGNISQREEYISSFGELIMTCQKENIAIFPLIMPNDPIIDYLRDNKYAIYMGDAVDFPDYYKFKYKFDTGHLNHMGAKLFTSRLAKKFKEIQNHLKEKTPDI